MTNEFRVDGQQAQQRLQAAEPKQQPIYRKIIFSLKKKVCQKLTIPRTQPILNVEKKNFLIKNILIQFFLRLFIYKL